MTDDEGRLIAGRYRLQSRIGSGAMGVVWRAVDARLDRTVAVKQLLLPHGVNEVEGERARQRAFREGRIAARLQHQHAISLYNVAEDDDGSPVLVMEYLPSRSLSDVLDERGVLPPAEVARIGAQVALALVAAHAAGVIHRDVKPGNVLLGNDGITKITDFGISRAAGDVTVTSTGLLAGTPAFLSPEAARGSEPGPAADVFSLGATLYAAVEGAPPFGNTENEIALLHTVATGQVIPPRQAGPLTAQLEAMLRTDVATRPTMQQVADGLQAVADGRPAIVPGPGEPPTMPATPPVQPPVQPLPTTGQAPMGTGPRSPQQRPSTRLDLHATSTPAQQAATAQAPVGRDAAGGRGTSGKRIALTVLAVLAAAAVGVLAAELIVSATERDANAGASSPAPSAPASTAPAVPRPTSASPSPASPTPTPQRPSPADVQQAVSRYYSLLPGNTDAAWTALGPGLQAQGRPAYDQFWRNVKKVGIVAGPRSVGTATVRVGLVFVVDGGDIYREIHRLGIVNADGQALINSDTVVSSHKTSADDGHRGGNHADDGHGTKPKDKKDEHGDDGDDEGDG